jgi:hypothetical protein
MSRVSHNLTVVTLHAPWAATIFYLGADVINRAVDTNYRGRLYIHTSANTTKLNDFNKFISSQRLKAHYINAGHSRLHISNSENSINTIMPLIYGAIIGSVDLLLYPRTDYYLESEWAECGKYNWIISNPLLLETPIITKGNPNLWNYDITLFNRAELDIIKKHQEDLESSASKKKTATT